MEKILDNANGSVTIVGDMNVDWLGAEGKHKKWRDDIGALALKNKMTETTRQGLNRDSCIAQVVENWHRNSSYFIH